MSDNAARLRKALADQFTTALAADFAADGAEAVRRLREKDPSAYVRAVLSVTADAAAVATTWTSLSDDDIAVAIDAIREARRARDGASGGEGSAAGGEPIVPLSPLREAEGVS
jgi:DNA-binding MurR/RpiR family transcriptional regulator